MSLKVIYIFLCSSLVSCLAEEIVFRECTEEDPNGWCRVNKIDISPCKEASSNKPCNLKKGKTSALKMYYTALEPIQTFKASPFWASAAADLPFVGMNEDACQFTQCPIAKGVEQIYDFQLKIAKSLPRGQFDVKWKFWANDNTTQGCCVKFFVRLT